MELVSIVIPFYKNKEWLIESVKSVLNQTYQNIEIIIVDDGSKQDLNELFNLSNKIQIIHTENMGASSARNTGIACSNGDYIAFLDSDDIWLPQKLELQLDFMKSNNYYWSATSYTLFDSNKSKFPEFDTIISSPDCSNMTIWNILSSTNLGTPTVIIHTSILKSRINFKFNEKLKFGEDTYLWATIAYKNKLGYINKNLSRVRLHGNNASRNILSQMMARSEIFELLNDEQIEIVNIMPIFLKMGYKLNYHFYNFYKNKCKSSNNKYLLTVIYFIPWSIFKIYSMISRRK